MNAELRLYILLLANVAVVVCSVSGTDIPTIYVCPEESVQAFQNINFDCCKSNVHLTRHMGKERQVKNIANWSFKNCVLNATFQSEHDHRFSLHKNGTITINNVQLQDHGEYDVMYENDNLSTLIHEVHIHVMVAPTKDCKPIVKNTGNVLKATVNHSVCGYPIVNVYWKCLNNDTGTERTLLNVDAGTKPCAYQYCIEGPALQCISDESHRNYCFPSTSTMQDTSTPHSSESCSEGYRVATFALLGVIALCIFIIVIQLIMLIRRGQCCRDCANICTTSGDGDSNMSRQLPEGTEAENIPLQDVRNDHR